MRPGWSAGLQAVVPYESGSPQGDCAVAAHEIRALNNFYLFYGSENKALGSALLHRISTGEGWC